MLYDASGRRVRRALGFIRAWVVDPEPARRPEVDLVGLERIPAEEAEVMNKYSAFFTCLAQYVQGSPAVRRVFDQAFSCPSGPAAIDTAADDDGPIGPARMAEQVAAYAERRGPRMPYMSALLGSLLLLVVAATLGAQTTATVTATPKSGGASKSVVITLRPKTILSTFTCDLVEMEPGDVASCTIAIT